MNSYFHLKARLKISLVSISEEPLTSAFHAAVLDDGETSLQDWNEVVHILQDQGYGETAMGLLAAITVMQAMKNALRTSQEDFQQTGTVENEKSDKVA